MNKRLGVVERVFVKPVLLYIFGPMIVLGVVVYILLADVRFFFGSVILAAIFAVLGLIAGKNRNKLDAKRGWRVGHVGRDAMYYEEFRDGAWRRIEIDGDMLVGKAHHIIYFASLKFPDWASERRDEIVARIKSEFHPPQYEYDDPS